MEINKEGEKLFKKLKANKKLSVEEATKLASYIGEINKSEKISKDEFLNEFKRIFPKYEPRAATQKLRDDRGRLIKLKNNKFKIISDEPSPFMASQFVALFRFTFQLTSSKFITKTVPGYTKMILSYQYKSEDDLVQLAYEKSALPRFLTSIGWNEGTNNIANKLKVELIDKFWITYTDYQALINHNIATSMES